MHGPINIRDDSLCTPELPRQKGKWGSERVLRWHR